MANEPLISVIVPVYNVEKYVAKCLDSIINQTHKNLEIIVVDDGSTDNSYSVCCSYAEKDDRVIVLQKPNGGLASARNYGMNHVHGDYVGFVDSDDFIELDTYECMLCATAGYPNSIVMCGRYNVDEQTLEKEAQFTHDSIMVYDTQTAIANVLTWNGVDSAVCDKLFLTSAIGERRFKGTLVSEDMMFTYEMFKRMDNLVHIGAPKYNYLQRTGSLSRAVKYHERLEGMRVHPLAISEDVKKNFPKILTEADCFKYTNYINYCTVLCKAGVPLKEVRKYLKQNSRAIYSNPFISKESKLICLLTVIGALKLVYKLRNAVKKHRRKK